MLQMHNTIPDSSHYPHHFGGHYKQKTTLSVSYSALQKAEVGLVVRVQRAVFCYWAGH
jgi:hypothetical protein